MSENLLLSNFKTTENWIEGLIVCCKEFSVEIEIE